MNKSGPTVLIVAGLLLASCNISNAPVASPGPEPDPAVRTAAAMTVNAVLTPLTSPTAAAPTATRAVTTAPASPTLTVTTTITPTYSVPMLTITGNTNCRTGPGEQYEVIFTFLPGAKVEIVGQYPEDNYWIVKLPGSSDTCWAWGQFATVSGSSWVVVTLQPPATRTPAPPEGPTGLTYQYNCSFNGVNTDIQVNLRWTDRSDGEEGFRVLRDGVVIAQLTPNTTTYSEVHDTDATTQVAYTIEVFRGDMTARSGTITFSCQ